MKHILFLVLAGISLPFSLRAQSPVVKIDFSQAGRQASEVAKTGYEFWNTFGAGPISNTYQGVTFTLAKEGANGDGLRSNWYKNGIRAAQLCNDGVTVDNGNDGAEISITIGGLATGTHSLLVFHSNVDGTDPAGFSPIDVYVDGQLTVDNVMPTVRVADDDDAEVSYFSVTATAGQDVVVLFKADIDAKPDAVNKNVVINGIELNTPNSRNQASYPIPQDMDEHVNDNMGRTTLSWAAAKNAVSHNVYLSDVKANLEGATTADNSFMGNQTDTSYTVSGLISMKTYYWRIDEIDANGNVTTGKTWYFRTRQLAFPGAEGYGRFARGGRGGQVVHVTNLNDSGAGSLRDAVENYDGPRTVVFDVSGIIKLESRLTLSDGYVTIAGQTAPGKGICIRSAPFGLSGANDVIIQNIRVRLGGGDTYDGMGMAGSDHCIIDHCSISWTIDESFSSRSGKNITLQRTLISEALNVAGHQNYPAGTMHGYAASISGDVGSFHHNLLAHNYGRNWSLAGGLDAGGNNFAGRLDIFNNVVYNWGSRATDGGAHEVNFVNNYYKPGPATTQHNALRAQYEDSFGGSQQYYVSGNVMPGFFDESNQEAGNIAEGAFRPTDYPAFVDAPFFESQATIHTAYEAYKNVLSDIGCTQPVFDDHDIRIVDETVNGTYTYKGSKSGLAGLPDNESDVGGYEDYPEVHRDANWDSDGDGMPNWWEEFFGLNPNSTDFAEANADPNNDGYTNLEDYLQWLNMPHYRVKINEPVTIKLADLFRGFTESPLYTYEAPKNVMVTINGANATVYPVSCGTGSVVFKVTDVDGHSLKREVALLQSGTENGDCTGYTSLSPFTVKDGLFDQAKPGDLGLPMAEGAETVTVFAPTENTDKFSNGAVMTSFKGKLYCQWQSSMNDEDAPETWVAYSRSDDGLNWGPKMTITQTIDTGYCSSGGWWVNGDTLVAFVNVWPSRTLPRGGLAYYATSTDGETWSGLQPVMMKNGEPMKAVFEQDPHALPNGRIINAAHFQPGLIINPIYTDDASGVRGWVRADFSNLFISGGISRSIEPSNFVRKDGTVVMIFRDQNSSFKKIAAMSVDDGETWTKPELTNMPDARTKQSAGNIGDSIVYMAGNPVNNKLRLPLAITLSKDGKFFNTAYLLRHADSIQALRTNGTAKRAGYHYPKSYVWNDHLYIAYTTNKEDVDVTRVPISSLKLDTHISVAAELEEHATYVVSQDGLGDFFSIQDAVDAIADNDNSRKVILVKNGIYEERVVIPASKTKLTIVGEDVNKTILTWNEGVDKQWVRENNVIIDGPHTAPTLAVDADDFSLMNMTVENSYGYQAAGPQALAIRTAGDRQSFLHCKFFSYQDTYMTYGRGRNYTKDCLIEGAVDFIFGTGVNVFDSCLLHNTRSGGYYTAASTDSLWKFGYVFFNSRLTTDKGESGEMLGRTWSNTTNCVFYECDMNNVLDNAGWKKWDSQTSTDFNVAEYNCVNAGDVSGRVGFSKQLTASEAADYTMANIFAKDVPAAPYSSYAADWMPNVDNDPIYAIVKRYSTAYLTEQDMDKAELTGVQINGAELPSFDPAVTQYVVDVNDNVPPVLYAVTAAPGAVYTYSPPASVPGFGALLVTSANRANATVYKVFFNKRDAYTDVSLAAVVFDTIAIAIEPNKFDYTYNVPAAVTQAVTDGKRLNITWTGAPDMATVEKSIARVLALPDTVTITVTAANGTTQKTYSFYLLTDAPIGITEASSNQGIAFINPMTNSLTGYVELDAPSDARIELYSITGSKVLTENLNGLVAGQNPIDINVSGLNTGTYVFVLWVNGTYVSGKLTKE